MIALCHKSKTARDILKPILRNGGRDKAPQVHKHQQHYSLPNEICKLSSQISGPVEDLCGRVLPSFIEVENSQGLHRLLRHQSGYTIVDIY